MLMDDALESSNVYLYNPEVGGDYRDVDGLAENPEIIETNEKTKILKSKTLLNLVIFLNMKKIKNLSKMLLLAFIICFRGGIK